MTWILTNVAALCVTLSVMTYLCIMAVLLVKLASEEATVRRQLAWHMVPAFCQNCGIPIVIAAIAFGQTQFAVIGALLIALGVVGTTRVTINLHPSIEQPLLMLALISLGLVGLIRFVL